MIRHRTEGQVKRYDIGKLVVLFILLGILFLALYTGERPTRDFDVAQTGEPATAATTQVGQAEGPTESSEEAAGFSAPTVDVFNLSPDGQLQLAGRAQPETNLQVAVDGQVAGETQADSSGAWVFEAAVEPGEHEVNVIARSARGTILRVSEPVQVAPAPPAATPMAETEVLSPTEEAAVPTQAPATTEPTVEAVAEATGEGSALPADAGSLSLNPPSQVTEGAGMTLSGTSQPGTIVEIAVDQEVIGTTPVDDEGRWSYTAPITEAGEYEITLRGLNDQGEIITTEYPVTLSLNENNKRVMLPVVGQGSKGEQAELGLSSFTLSGSGEPGQQVEIVLDGQVLTSTAIAEDGQWSLTGTLPATTPGGSAEEPSAAEETSEVVTGRLIAGQPLVFRGRGTPGSELEIVIDNQSLGTTTVDENGRWEFIGTVMLPGEHQLVVNKLNEAGGVTVSSVPLTLMLEAE
jgi:hypothetical protein